MSSNTLETAYANGSVIDASHINELTLAQLGTLYGRNASGVPTSNQDLGSVALPFGTLHAGSVVVDGEAVDTTLLTTPKNRIVSGKTRSTSNQPQFISPNGAAASFILEGASIPLTLDINGVAVSVSTDITKSGITVGPSTTATCLVNMATAADQESTKTWGEVGGEFETITVDAMGPEFQAYIGQFVIVEISGVTTEYALAFVKSATELTNCYRGWFTNSSASPVNRSGFSDNDTITVLATNYVFVENNGTTVDLTTLTPISSYTAPTGVVGQYWEDLNTKSWKRHNGASYEIINRTLVGMVGVDATNCVCARSFDFYNKYSDMNSVELEISSTEIIKIKNQNAKISVYGTELAFKFALDAWNITIDLATAADRYAATEQASTVEYLYLADTGETFFSDVSPHYRPDLGGDYHPHNPWRMVGMAYNNASSNLDTIWSEFSTSKNQSLSGSCGVYSSSSTSSVTITNLSLGVLSRGIKSHCLEMFAVGFATNPTDSTYIQTISNASAYISFRDNTTVIDVRTPNESANARLVPFIKSEKRLSVGYHQIDIQVGLSTGSVSITHYKLKTNEV